MTLTDGRIADFIVKNGTQGPKGDKGDPGGILDVYESSTKGYISVKEANGNIKNVPVGDPNALLTTGGTMTGTLTIDNNLSFGKLELFEDEEGGTIRLWGKNGTYCYEFDSYNDTQLRIHTHTSNPTGTGHSFVFDGSNGNFSATTVTGAVWNDYAEYREANTTEPGRVVYEVGDDTLALANERMMPACSIVSDTFGFAIGETEKCKTPLAQAGRVLAYTFEDRNSYKPGDAVCSGPNGTISKMTDDEKMKHPECIIGYISCVPNYETWGENNTVINGRVWVRIA